MKKSLSALVFTGVMLTQPLLSVSASPLSWTARTSDDVVASVMESINRQTSYQVQWGDTLSSIARALDMSVLEIAALNNIDNPDLIIAGTVITFDKSSHVVTLNNEVSYSTYTGQEVESVAIEETAASTSVSESTSELTTENVEISTPTTEVVEPTVEVTSQEVTTSVTSSQEETTVPATTTTTEEVTAAPTTTTTEEVTAAPTTTTTTEEVTIAPTTTPTTEEVTIAPTTTTTTEEVTAAPTTTTTTEEVTAAPTTTTTTEEVTAAPVKRYNMTAYEAFEVIVAEKGLGQNEKEMWAFIINRESGWNPTIANPSSGAYGLPQALPGNKMASHGADWATNPYTQLLWMYDYMVGRYGSIAGAYQHSVNVGWY